MHSGVQFELAARGSKLRDRYHAQQNLASTIPQRFGRDWSNWSRCDAAAMLPSPERTGICR
jgi:hypothetical protein